MQFVTDFADQAVILPLVLTVAIILAVFAWPQAALAWVVAVSAAFGLTLIGKLVFLPCGPCIFGMVLRSPSGHTAAAATVYGGMAALLVPKRWRYLAAAAVSTLAGTTIAVTRVALGAHTGVEVALGAVIGIAGAMLLARLAGERPPGSFKRPAAIRLMIVSTVLGLFLHGWHLHAEVVIHRLAFTWRLIGACVQ